MTHKSAWRIVSVACIFGGLSVGCAGPGSQQRDPPPSASQLVHYEGYHDVTNCNGISGWAWDQTRPDAPIAVDVYDGDQFLVKVTAETFRADLLGAKIGNGKHGFLVTTFDQLKDGKPHRINMKYSGTQVMLRSGPKEITCDR